MRLYLDDDLDGNILISLLQHAGHAVVSPRVVSTRGVLDPAHLRYAADHDLVLLTANAKDFLALHVQWQQEGPEHSGMLLVYRENNPQRDMTFQEMVRAVSRLDQAGIPLRNTYQNLNFGENLGDRGDYLARKRR